MKKIIHLSDTHLGYDGLSDRMEEIVVGMISKIENPRDYIVVHTGDIVEDANLESSYDDALKHFDRLKSAGFTVLFAPGNHDYGTGSIGHKKFINKFKESFYGTSDLSFPKKNIIDNIAFIALDSMAEELNWHDRLFAEGELGLTQLAALSKVLNNQDVKDAEYTVVYLHHHPFHPWPFHYLKDAEELGKVLQKSKIDALLFGHNHSGDVWNGEWGIKRVYDAGTSTGKGGKPSPHRVIDLSKTVETDYDAEF